MKLFRHVRVWAHGARRGAACSSCVRNVTLYDSGRSPISAFSQTCNFRSISYEARHESRQGGAAQWSLAAAVAAFGCVSGSELWRRHRDPTHSEAAEEKPSPDELKKAQAPGKLDGLPLFTRLGRYRDCLEIGRSLIGPCCRRAEVAEHNKAEVGIWVTYKEVPQLVRTPPWPSSPARVRLLFEAIEALRLALAQGAQGLRGGRGQHVQRTGGYGGGSSSASSGRARAERPRPSSFPRSDSVHFRQSPAAR